MSQGRVIGRSLHLAMPDSYPCVGKAPETHGRVLVVWPRNGLWPGIASNIVLLPHFRKPLLSRPCTILT
jgi:hypothetical protein